MITNKKHIGEFKTTLIVTIYFSLVGRVIFGILIKCVYF